jgi:hypothetical protein
MGPPSIKPPVRVLIRTRPNHLQKIHCSFDQADTILIEKLCVELSITDRSKINHLITKTSNEKNLKERVDIVFDYDVPTNGCQPQVVAYTVTVVGSDLTVKQFIHPQIQSTVNRTVEVFRSINLENGQSFPNRPDIRAETRRKRLALRDAMLPVSMPRSNVIRTLDTNIFTD